MRGNQNCRRPFRREGKLDLLRIECTRCGRKGRYRVRSLIEKYGRKASMMKCRKILNLTVKLPILGD